MGGEAKDGYCVIDPWCVFSEMWDEVKETVEHRVYNATQNNQIVALWHMNYTFGFL